MNKKQKQHKTAVPGHFAGVTVVDNDLAYALRSFKRRVKETGVLEKIKDNYFNFSMGKGGVSQSRSGLVLYMGLLLEKVHRCLLV